MTASERIALESLANRRKTAQALAMRTRVGVSWGPPMDYRDKPNLMAMESVELIGVMG